MNIQLSPDKTGYIGCVWVLDIKYLYFYQRPSLSGFLKNSFKVFLD